MSQAHGSPTVLAVLGRWLPASVAAVLLVATMLIAFGPGRSATMGDFANPGILPVNQVHDFAARHVHCRDQIEQLVRSTEFPAQITQMPDAIASRTGGRPYPSLDLSALGYTFWKAGECNLPGSNSVHLIYRAAPDTGRSDSLSLWIIRDEGQLNHLDEGKTYLASPPDAVHPLIVWRAGGMIYYLIGDAQPLVQKAATQLASR